MTRHLPGMHKPVTILTGDPTVEVLAEMRLDYVGIDRMAAWVESHRPECLPDDLVGDPGIQVHMNDPKWRSRQLFPHNLLRTVEGREVGDPISDNELLVELAGRKCYDSFGLKAGRKSNAEYIVNTQGGEIPHASIMYHAKMTFFIAGVSRRLSQEMFRNYVGADRDVEGSPSQESSRFTHHYGFFVAHPTLVQDPEELELWKQDCQAGYDRYVGYIERRFAAYEKKNGKAPVGMDRKRIYESSIGRMPWDFETSFVWTTNPVAVAKFIRERQDNASDVEMQRFARKWKAVCLERWPNLFPQPWMKP